MSTFVATSSPYSAIFHAGKAEPVAVVENRGPEWATEEYQDLPICEQRPDLVAALGSADTARFLSEVTDSAGRVWQLFELYGSGLDLVVVGDRLTRYGRHVEIHVITVTRLTKTLIVCDSDKYTKTRGSRHGSGSWDGHVKIYTRDDQKAVDRGEEALSIYEAQKDVSERIRRRISQVTGALQNHRPDKAISAEMLAQFQANLEALKSLEKGVESALARPQGDSD